MWVKYKTHSMAGIYLHIPFCRKACHYCDFHFSTSFGLKDEILHFMRRELELRLNAITEVSSIYFGGGTPSVLSGEEISDFMRIIRQQFDLTPSLEVTLEANPDDLTAEKLTEFKSAGINRLSVGVQSFYDEDLEWMNRSHNAQQAEQSLRLAADFGFENLSLDLIFGYPLLTEEKWNYNISRALQLPINHISCYSMTVESGTALFHQIKKGQTPHLPDELSNVQYLKLIDRLTSSGWDHYEHSNFCLPGKRSRHNSAYWDGLPYLGIGPGAHGFMDRKRYWNPSSNSQYVRAWKAGENPENWEELSTLDIHNEFLMTQLRQSRGLQLEGYQEKFGEHMLHLLLSEAEPFLHNEQLIQEDGHLRLSLKGRLISDHIIAELFQLEA